MCLCVFACHSIVVRTFWLVLGFILLGKGARGSIKSMGVHTIIEPMCEKVRPNAVFHLCNSVVILNFILNMSSGFADLTPCC